MDYKWKKIDKEEFPGSPPWLTLPTHKCETCNINGLYVQSDHSIWPCEMKVSNYANR
jgi:hypothetical protein